MNRSEEFKQYLAGFFDGDGSITVEKFKGGYTLRIKFAQSNLDWIKKIYLYYPFMHYDGGLRNGRNNIRCEYQIRAAGKQIEPLVDDLLPYSILKYEQLLEAKKMFPLINVQGTNQQKEEIYQKLKELKKESTNKPYERLSIPYIAGIFDAEGYLSIKKNYVNITIAQKSDYIFLKEIAKFYAIEIKNNDQEHLRIPAKHRNKFLLDIIPFCIYKKPQIETALAYLESDDIEEKNKLAEHVDNLKKIDISLDNYYFKTQEEHKNYIIECFKEFQKLSTEDLVHFSKYTEICQVKPNTKFEKKIYNHTPEEWKDIKINPILEFCENTHQLSLYNYYRKKISSLPTTGVIGRNIRILVKDQITEMYIGIMCISSDVYSLGERDKFLGLDNTNKNKYLKNIMNLSCCVPLQPFGYNTNGGKLIASLAFSKEVFDYYYNKYKEPLLGIVTTSINGKSIQYDRLNCMKFIGFTKGYGTVYFPEQLYKVCKEYNSTWKITSNGDRVDKFNILKQLLSHLKLSDNILHHGKQRGIYFGYLFSTKLDNNFNVNELKTVQYIYQYWKKRWCDNRINNLINTNRITTELRLYTKEFFEKNIEFKHYTLPKIIQKYIDDDLIKYILTFKSKIMTFQEICDEVNQNLPFNLCVNDISRIFTGKLKPIFIDEEYTTLFEKERIKKINSDDVIISNQSIHNQRSIKLNTDCINDIVNNRFQNMTTQEVSDNIKNKYNIHLSRNLISKLWNGEDNFLHPDSISELQNHIKYNEMINNHTQRVIKRKFLNDELEFLRTFNGSLTQCCQEFKRIYNKDVTRAYISKLRKK